ncbi:hypothetical protein BH20ACT24_BH20ACT24_14660 [soil metagenome]
MRAKAGPDTVVAMQARRNSVSPRDVGRRVSFQYELPNGFVSEAVGVLEAWDDAANTYLVRTKDGELARVPALGVRFGKVVPG